MAYEDGVEYNAGDQPFVQVWVGDPAGNPIYLGVMPDGRGNELGSLVSFSFEHEQGNVGHLSLELFDPTHGDIEDKIFASRVLDSPADGGKVTGSAILGFQFGWAQGAKSLKWIAHVTKFITNFDLGSGTRISIEAVCSPGHLQIGRSTKVWKKGTPVKDIIDFYAMAAGAPTPSVIEPPAQDIGVDLSTFGQSVKSFLSNVLAKHIVSKENGRGGYVFNVDGADQGRYQLTTDGRKVDNTEWIYVWGREQNSILESFEVSLNSQIMRSLGGQGVKVECFDRRSKKPKSHVINDTTAKGRLVLEDNIAPASEYPRVIRCGLDDEQSAIAYAEDKFVAMNMLNITATAVLHGNPAIQLLDLVTVLVARTRDSGEVNVKNIKDLHPASGKYFIRKIIQHITAGGEFKTELALMKQGAKDANYGGSANTKGTRIAKVAAKIANESYIKAKDAVKKAEERRAKKSQEVGKK